MRSTKLLVLCALAACDATPDHQQPADTEPILTVGHGAFFSRDGKPLQPTETTFRATQQVYIARLEPGVAGAAEMRAQLRAETPDDIIANARYIAWLLERTNDAQHATIKAVNGAIRMLRARDVPDGDLEIAARATYNGGQKYIDECALAGVPIPPAVFSADWVRLGSFDGSEVIGMSSVPELWKWEPSAGAENPGVCLALPRYSTSSGGDIEFLGMICMGTRPARPPVCFWDNPHPGSWTRGGTVERPAERPLSQFVSGFDLEAQVSIGGVCTDCHAGENPYVVHRDLPAFAGARNKFGGDLYEPLVHPNWPQNAEATHVLDRTPTSPRQCTTCHSRSGEGRRFPNISTELSGYCNVVLKSVAFDDWTMAGDQAVRRTMPPQPASVWGVYTEYEQDLRDLETACGQAPIGGKFGTPDPFTPSNFISRPRLVGPLYGCAKRVAVRDVALDALVVLTVTRGGTLLDTYSKTATQTVELDFDLSAALEVGDVVEVEQRIDGGMSVRDTITVRDWHTDFDALPQPMIDPTEIYQCSSVIAVRHLVGATLQVQVDEGADQWYLGAGDWSALVPGLAPFDIGNKFRARITMCPGDAPSEWSTEMAESQPAPGSLLTPRLEPTLTFPGQRLVTIGNLTNGTLNRTSVNTTPTGDFMTPISWLPDFNLGAALGRALATGDTITVRSELCESTKPTTLTAAQTGTCSQLPAPRVERASAGANFIVMSEWVPGARIVVAAGASEIGDGSGTVITLSQPLVAGERISVTQRIGENCTSSRAHIITVP
jgi:hypothetical protein